MYFVSFLSSGIRESSIQDVLLKYALRIIAKSVTPGEEVVESRGISKDRRRSTKCDLHANRTI
jgi:hypothetical protein